MLLQTRRHGRNAREKNTEHIDIAHISCSLENLPTKMLQKKKRQNKKNRTVEFGELKLFDKIDMKVIFVRTLYLTVISCIFTSFPNLAY